MNFIAPDFGLIAPEIFVLGMACLVLLADLYVDDKKQTLSFYLSLAAVLGAVVLTALGGSGGRVISFGGSFVADPLAHLLKLSTYVTVGVIFVYSREYLAERGLSRGEYYALGLFGMLGIMVMISAHNFLTVFLGLELLSLSLYAMVAFDRDSPVAAEAAMKYFVLGAIASGTLLYGLSILYGLTGTLDLDVLGSTLAQKDEVGLALALALAFLLVGVAFKLGAVPFHMWIPDVYHGAPTTVTLYIGTASKIGAFALIARVVAEGLSGIHETWSVMLVVLAVLSMGIGNVVAIAQSNLKRMLAYSTISHVGFILLGFIAGGAEGYRAALFYTLSYVLMALGGFGMILLLSRRGFEADRLDDFKGLNRRSPWFAFMMLILMFSMAGVPPFLGFYAKVAVIGAVIEVGQVWLALVAVAFSVVGAYYYLRLVKLMYFDEPEPDQPGIEAGFGIRTVLSANGLAVLFFGLFPAGLLAICARAIA